MFTWASMDLPTSVEYHPSMTYLGQRQLLQDHLPTITGYVEFNKKVRPGMIRLILGSPDIELFKYTKGTTYEKRARAQEYVNRKVPLAVGEPKEEGTIGTKEKRKPTTVPKRKRVYKLKPKKKGEGNPFESKWKEPSVRDSIY